MTDETDHDILSRDALISDAFVLLVDSLVDEHGVAELLNRLVRVCCELLDARAAGILLDDQRGRLAVVAASSERSRLLEVLQLHNDEGPCLDCLRTGRPLYGVDLEQDEARWPTFAPAARAAGFRSLSGIPLRMRGTSIGVLNLFHEHVGGLSEAEQRLADALAGVAAVCVVQQRSAERSSVLVEQLEHALSSRVAIEQAKGILAERHGLSLEAAFELLRRYARRHNRRLADVAVAVAGGTLTLAPPGRLDTGSSADGFRTPAAARAAPRAAGLAAAPAPATAAARRR